MHNITNFNDINYILNKDNLSITLPVMKENLEYIKQLKTKGYKIYLLSNITEESYNYINSIISINRDFDGGVYSYQEHLVKPDSKIYQVLINRFKLNKYESIFFDDKIKNVIAASNIGIKSVVFKSIDDIKDNL